MGKEIGSLLTGADRKLLKLFGNRVRQLRESKDASVYDLTGEDMPIRSRQHWQLIENGQKNVSLVTVFKIAKSLNVSIHDLMKGIG